MKSPGILSACFFVFLAVPAFAQQPLPVPRNLQVPYLKGTRASDGKPGPKYWQNTADYDINVNFDPATRLMQGTVAIAYVISNILIAVVIGGILLPIVFIVSVIFSIIGFTKAKDGTNYRYPFALRLIK